jgi:hypothetical protein
VQDGDQMAFRVFPIATFLDEGRDRLAEDQLGRGFHLFPIVGACAHGMTHDEDFI